MWDELPGDDRAKRDRTARLLNVVQVLRANGTHGVTPAEIAKRTGISRRTVYRDLHAIGGELGIPVWSEGGRWGVDADAFLPPLRLTLSEAMAIVLSARLLVRYMDKHDPVLASAFTKLEEGLPPSLRDHVERTVQALASRDVDPVFNRHVEDLTKAWADRRVVTFEYAPAPYAGHREPRRATVRPYLLEPSLQTHALYLIGWDEERAGDAHVQGGADPGPRRRAADVRRARGGRRRPAAQRVGHHRGPAGDGGRAAVPARGRGPRDGGPVAPEPARRGAAGRVARVARRPWPARSRSGCGSCSGAATWRSWSRPPCARTSRRPCARR